MFVHKPKSTNCQEVMTVYRGEKRQGERERGRERERDMEGKKRKRKVNKKVISFLNQQLLTVNS